MNTAPLLHAAGDSAAERMLLAAYTEWRQHYEWCTVCNVGPFYEPDFRLRPCRIGEMRFRRWATLGVATNIPQTFAGTKLHKEAS
jgi:hypothetical protein